VIFHLLIGLAFALLLNSNRINPTIRSLLRVLYILPWQPPTLPRRTRAELEAGNEGLLEPKDPLTLERHRKFRETLNPSLDSTLSLQ